MPTQPPPDFQNVHLVLNPGSGSFPGREALPIEPSWTVHEVGDEGPKALAERAARVGADLVIAAGGDGTVNGTAHGLLGSDAVLGIVPMGTANVLATDLRVPADPVDAMNLFHTFERTTVRTIDGGAHGPDLEGFFMLRLGLGIEATMVTHSDPELKAKVGRLAYFKTFLDEVRRQQPVRYHITTDGQTHQSRGVTCLVCNTGNPGMRGVNLLPSIAIDDGRLTVVVIRRITAGLVASLVGSAVRSGLAGRGFRVEHSRRLRLYAGREVQVWSDPPQEAACDGEALTDAPPLKARVLPSALRVLVPSESVEAR
jgi:diacylglycerol kinase family enzyme